MRKAVLFLIWLVLAVPCAGDIIIVDDGGHGDFDNIQAAIDYSNDGDIIYILPGTYTGPANRNIDYGGRAITVTGVEPQDPYIVAATIIDCESAGRGFEFYSEGPNSVLTGLTITNGYATLGGGIYCDGSPKIIECVISNSTATVRGGGMHCEGVPLGAIEGPSPIVMNCRFINNSAERGGGLYVMHCFELSETFADCQVTGNEASYGGGLYLRYGTVSGCTISDNTASRGGGVYCESANVKNCTVGGNIADEGGGIYCVDGEVNECTISGNAADNGGGAYITDGVIKNCTVTANIAGDYEGTGGGIYGAMWEVGYGATVLNCEVTGNSSDRSGGGLAFCQKVANCIITGNTTAGPCGAGDGGGLYSCDKVINCIISGNVAADMGGGIYSFWATNRIHNCTFSGNVADSGGAVAFGYHAIGFVLSNSILWGNRSNLPDANEIYMGSAYFISANYNCIEDGSWVEGVGNIVDNPMFVREPNDGGDGWGDDPATPDVNEAANDDFGDLHITAPSLCINAGDPCLHIGADYGDIDGQPRVMGFRADMGADEFLIPMITLTKPEGGEVWVSGSIHNLAWVNCMYEANVDILLSIDDGNNWQSIEANLPDTGSYVWALPVEVDSNQCVIAVVPSVPDPNVICIESGLFTIHPDSPGPPVASKWKSLGGDYDRRGLSEDYGPQLGCVKWTFEAGGPIPASVTIGAYDRVHVPCEDGRVYTLDANGALVWSFDTNSALLSAASVGPDGTIYVGTESGRLYAVDVNGQVRWTHDADGFISSSPAVSPDGNTIYVCSSNGVLYSLRQNGSVLWTFRTNDTTAIGSSIFASPAVGPDGTVYVAAVRDPNLYALDHNNGTVKWACNFEYLIDWHVPDAGTYFGWPLASPVVAPDGKIYQTLLYDPNLYAIEPNTGVILWSLKGTRYRPYADSDGWSEPAVGPDGTVYFGASDANLWAVYPNGAIKWVTRLGWTTGVTLTVGSGGLIYAADNDGWLCVVDANGNELARFYSGGWLNSPVISADDTIIIADVNNRVWAIESGDCGEGPFALHRPEDLNGSLSVNFRDFALLAADWLESDSPYLGWPYPWPPDEWDGTYFAGDVDRNLDVDFADLAAMANRWLTGD